MDVVSLSISVINAHNTNKSDLFAITCSQLDDAVMGKEFRFHIDSEHCYIIGRALYYSFHYNNRCNPMVNEMEILKRMFLCLTRTIFTYEDEQKICAAKLLFITFYRNWDLLNQLWKKEEITSSAIQNEFVLHSIEDLLRKGVISDLNWCILDIEDETWYQRADDNYTYNNRSKSFTWNDLNTGQEYIKSCYKLLYESIRF